MTSTRCGSPRPCSSSPRTPPTSSRPGRCDRSRWPSTVWRCEFGCVTMDRDPPRTWTGCSSGSGAVPIRPVRRRGPRHGAGLGLSIVAAIAVAHDGRALRPSSAWAPPSPCACHAPADRPTPGPTRGARVLPSPGAAAANRPADGRRAHPPTGSRDVAAILVAEDEPRIASFVEKGLSAAGFGVQTRGDRSRRPSKPRSPVSSTCSSSTSACLGRTVRGVAPPLRGQPERCR